MTQQASDNLKIRYRRDLQDILQDATIEAPIKLSLALQYSVGPDLIAWGLSRVNVNDGDDEINEVDP